MIKLSEILNVDSNNNLIDSINNKIDYDGVHTLTFRDIEFDDLFLWKTDESLMFGFNTIDEINSIDTSSKSKIKKVIFNNCIFATEFSITKHQIWLIECSNCKFKGSSDFTNTLLKYNDKSSKRIIFNSCNFEYFNIGDISNIQYNLDTKICRFYLYGGKIQNMSIQNIELSSKLYFNRQGGDGNGDNTLRTKIDKLIINNTIFKSNFKLHNCNIQNVKIKDTDFKKQADFYKSSFHNGVNQCGNDKSIYFNALNFSGLTILGHCEFTNKIIFSAVTFENFVHFKEAKFEKGLDLDYTNIQKEMNFFGVTGLDNIESQKNTSQETYRIIKYNFQKIGNQIEANKYHALELDVHRQYIWNKLKKEFSFNMFYYKTQELIKLLSDIVPSFIHWLSSKYAQSWLLPLFWILVVGWVTNCMISDVNDLFNYTEVLKYVSIVNFDKELKDSSGIFLFNKISLGYLYYQFVSAIRKNTKK